MKPAKTVGFSGEKLKKAEFFRAKAVQSRIFKPENHCLAFYAQTP